jgi:ribosomal protein S27E
MFNKQDVTKLVMFSEDTLRRGCRECNYDQLAFTAGISVEPRTRVYFLDIDCPKCGTSYKEIMNMEEIE